MYTDQKLKWAILTTGWGRNAKDTIEAFQKGMLKRSTIDVLFYQALPSGAVDAATEAGIATKRFIRKEYDTPESYQDDICSELKNRNIDYIFLLSYKYIVRQGLLDAFPNRIINIHPSLFPSFLATTTAIQEALDYGVKISGITTHIIDDKIDEGTILCQEPIRFEEGETFETVYPKFAEKGKKIILDTITLIEQRQFDH
ncbi:phosphoribosylglycinamide formyltransferase [Flavobacteriaceae bacterium TP-CH-4]|uniref:phosphoribosylglycinamide formyltransferase 1 n=1 Tax=Pelagihabitans pacificus TaxID=2696054 RepID=A0A967AVD0_9FLAO|nr:formyltransferase family protein [Pelagihabitans pacificus]NHF61071.1 phosphoribosylglycinamide formyltransferase [Pelagihabitans pacificus]